MEWKYVKQIILEKNDILIEGKVNKIIEKLENGCEAVEVVSNTVIEKLDEYGIWILDIEKEHETTWTLRKRLSTKSLEELYI